MNNQNNKLAVGVFAKYQELEPAIKELNASGFPIEKVSILAKDVEQDTINGQAKISNKIGNQDVDTTGVVGDTLTATTWGSLLVGFSSLALPGLGALLAAGSVGVALVVSMAGVAVGVTANENLVRSLTNLGIPEERARMYSDRLQQSYYLIILDATDPEINHAESILRQKGIQNWGIFDSSQATTIGASNG